jgi:flagellar protein FlbB
MKRACFRSAAVTALVFIMVLVPCSVTFKNLLTAESLNAEKKARPENRNAAPLTQPPVDVGKSAKHDDTAEREAAMGMKERELKRLGDNVDARIKELDETRKKMDASLALKNAQDAERYKKMIKLYKSLRPEAAAKLIDKLDEDIAMEMLNQMDQKTAAKLIPYLNQERVLKWTRLSLKGK